MNWKFIDRNATAPLCPQQDDGYNCGIFVLWFIYCKLSHNNEIRPLEMNTKELRLQLAMSLAVGKLNSLRF